MVLPHPLQQLHDLDKTSPQFHDQFTHFLRGDEYRNGVSNLQGEDLTWLVEYLDGILVGASDYASLVFQESLHELGRICAIKQVLPESCTLSDPLLDVIPPSAPGGACEGTLKGSKVRVEGVGIDAKGDPPKVRESFHRLAVMWKHLAHPNIVPFLGIITDPLRFALDWMPGGDLIAYITNHPGTDRLSLISDVAEGLNFLHSCNLVHGNLKESNILVDAAGRARITDFGLAAAQNLGLIQSASPEQSHSPRWTAPEILDGQGRYSKEADIFALGTVMVGAFADAVSSHADSPHAVESSIADSQHPPRPTHPTFTDELWALTQRCWDHETGLRPQSSEVLRILHDFGPPTWKRLVNSPFITRESIPLIKAIFSDKTKIGVVQSLRGDDAQSFIDTIAEAFDLPDLAPWLRRKCLTTLCRICSHRAMLPRSLQIPQCYNRLDIPRAKGGYADVWMGEYQGGQVAVKVLRVYSTTDLVTITRRFCKEVMTWKILRHPNVLPLLGVTMDKTQFAMISEWMVNGNINEYIKANGDANRFELLQDVARGLIYIHAQSMIHGDLKGVNILIDQDSHARLADFGLISILSDPKYPTTSSSPTKAGSVRWLSPELINPEQFGFRYGRHTKESDCYALGMVTYEVLSGQIPFPKRVDLTVMVKVVDGKRPGRPRGMKGVWFTNDLWGMLKRCWAVPPESRPSIETVLECFVQVGRTWKPPSQGDEVDGEEMGDGMEESDEDTDTDEDPETDATVETTGYLDTDAD